MMFDMKRKEEAIYFRRVIRRRGLFFSLYPKAPATAENTSAALVEICRMARVSRLRFDAAGKSGMRRKFPRFARAANTAGGMFTSCITLSHVDAL